MKKVLILLNDYQISDNMSGIGLRMYEIAQVLSKYCEITIYSRKHSNLNFFNINIVGYKDDNWKKHVEKCDTVISTDIPDLKMLLYAYQLNKQIIVENAIPIEHLFYDKIKKSNDIDHLYSTLIKQYYFQLLISDSFIVHSLPHEQTLISSLALVGRINSLSYSNDKQLEGLIHNIPIGFNSYSDNQSVIMKYDTEYDDGSYSDFLWSGGIWDYLNPTLIVDGLRYSKTKYKVYFLYGPPDDQYISEYQNLKNNITRYDIKSINLLEKVPHEKRDVYIHHTKNLICIGKNTLENKTCHRLRLRDCFLYNKPIITDSFGATGQFVQATNIGMTVSNEQELSTAMEILMNDKQRYQEYVSSIKKIRSKFLIDNNIKTLLNAILIDRRAKDINTHFWSKKVKSFIQNNSAIFNTLEII